LEFLFFSIYSFIISWIIVGWVSELTIVVFGVKVSDNGSADLGEVGNIHGVGDVGVQVIFEMLEHVHVFLNVLISSNSWEGECGVEKSPGVNLWCWLSEFTGNLSGVLVVLEVEVSGELVHLPVQLVFAQPESFLAGTLLWGKSINDAVITNDGLAGLEHVVVVIRFRVRFGTIGLGSGVGAELSQGGGFWLAGGDSAEEK